MPIANEFSIIAKYFKPLAAGFTGSLNLSDDAAIIAQLPDSELVITKDAISQGIHFIGNEPPELIAGKALRVNLSDLAAMGATPLCYFLALMLPKNTSEQWLEKFAGGLKQTQEEFNISLAGGDTTATEGSLSISITAIGTVPKGAGLKRSGAKAGDDIYVSGTLGDSALGLLSCQRRLASSSDSPIDASLRWHDKDFFINRYLTPEPRIKLGEKLRGTATSAMDISDGLAQDLGHICTASNVGAIIYAEKIPISKCHPALVAGSGENHTDLTYNTRPRNECGVTIEKALTGGDDYELLFTAAADKRQFIAALAKPLNMPLTLIGQITQDKNIIILDKNNDILQLDKKGFAHF